MTQPDSNISPSRLTADRLDAELAAWKRGFGAGMLPFDRAWLNAKNRGEVEAEAQRQGAHALLDAFAGRLKEVARDG